MTRSMRIEHYSLGDDFELVVCGDRQIFVVDRQREELRNIFDPNQVLVLAQRQSGRTPDGELEVLERYAADDELGESVVLDSSPTWLAQLPRIRF